VERRDPSANTIRQPVCGHVAKTFRILARRLVDRMTIRELPATRFSHSFDAGLVHSRTRANSAAAGKWAMALRDATKRCPASTRGTILCLPVAVVAALAATAVARAATCTVMVVTTDANGNQDTDVPAFDPPCRPGEKDGGVEYYNPSTDKYRFTTIPNAPISSGGSIGTTGGSAAGPSTSSTANANVPSGCMPVARNGTKTTAQTMQTKGFVPCPSPAAGPGAR
jgi:hypothetical protein